MFQSKVYLKTTTNSGITTRWDWENIFFNLCLGWTDPSKCLQSCLYCLPLYNSSLTLNQAAKELCLSEGNLSPAGNWTPDLKLLSPVSLTSFAASFLLHGNFTGWLFYLIWLQNCAIRCGRAPGPLFLPWACSQTFSEREKFSVVVLINGFVSGQWCRLKVPELFRLSMV